MEREHVYLVPPAGMRSFIAVSHGMMRVALQSGLPLPSWSVNRQIPGDDGVTYNEVVVRIPAELGPFQGAFRAVGGIIHRADGNGGYDNKIATLPGCRDVVPAEARSAAPRCDQCNRRRARTMTYLVYHPAGEELIWCGSDCLRDVLGSDQAASYVQWLVKFDETLGAASEAKDHGGHTEQQVVRARREDWIPGIMSVPTHLYLSSVCAAVRAHGWVTSGENSASQPTWERAVTQEAAPEDMAQADTILAWARSSFAPSSEFQVAARAVVLGERLDVAQRSLAAALVPLYIRASAPLPAVSHAPITTTAGRATITGRLIRREVAADPEGVVFHMLIDDLGRRVAWCSRTSVLETDRTYTVTGNVRERIVLPDGPVTMLRSVAIEDRQRSGARSVAALRRYLRHAA